MTSEEKVKQIYPRAAALFRSGVGYAVFFAGGPVCRGPHLGMSDPDVYSSNSTPGSAWVNARKLLQKRGELRRNGY